MEVRIRLQRVGKAQKHYNYRIVAMGKSKPRQGKHLDILGHYDPAKKPAEFEIDQEKLDKWLNNGAQMSETIKSLVSKQKKEINFF